MEKKSLHAGHRARLKQEFLARGLEGWPEHKVLELLLCYAIPQGDVNPLAHRLVERFGDLAGILDAPIEVLKEVPGMGEHSALLMKLVPQLCGRYLSEVQGVRADEAADHTADYARLLLPYFTGAICERCCMISLDSRRKVVGVDLIGEGSVDQVLLDSRRVMEAALLRKAKGVVLAHNHVGAYANPSIADLEMTNELHQLLEKVRITLIDHLIFNGEEYISMRDSGFMSGM